MAELARCLCPTSKDIMALIQIASCQLMILLIDMVPIFITKLTYSMKVFEIFNQICIKMKSIPYAMPKFKIVGVNLESEFTTEMFSGLNHLLSPVL
jgi:hypothetical protein